MANIKSQIKRNRQNEKRRLRNRDFRGAARTAVKEARLALESGQETAGSMKAALSALDIAAKKGAIHQRNAARRKSRLMKRMAALGLQAQAGPAESVPAGALVEQEAESKAARVEKESRGARESKPKVEEAKKPAAKPAARTAKKTAAKKSTGRK